MRGMLFPFFRISDTASEGRRISGRPDIVSHNVYGLARRHAERMPWWLRSLISVSARWNTELRWALGNAHWTFDTNTLPDLVAELRRYDDRAWAADIEADVLVLLGEAEHFFDPRLGHDFAGRLTGARSVTVHEFPSAEGGGLHCQNGAAHLAHEVIFDWATTVTPS